MFLRSILQEGSKNHPQASRYPDSTFQRPWVLQLMAPLDKISLHLDWNCFLMEIAFFSLRICQDCAHRRGGTTPRCCCCHDDSALPSCASLCLQNFRLFSSSSHRTEHDLDHKEKCGHKLVWRPSRWEGTSKKKLGAMHEVNWRPLSFYLRKQASYSIHLSEAV